MALKNQLDKIYLVVGADGECEDFEELVGVSWCEDRINDDDLEYISVDFIKSFLDIECFNNKSVWEDDEYLEENYPVQYLLKQLIK